MISIKNIVVPYDFSERCRAAAGHAAVLARRFEARITLLHVIPFSSFEYSAFEGGSYVGAAWPSEVDVLEKLRLELANLEIPDSQKENVSIEVRKGEPPKRITEIVSGLEAPLVVMPTHGHGRFRRFVLGSVAAKCLHDLDCPVLTGAHMDDAPPFSVNSYQQVACAIDLSAHSLATLRFAADFAAGWDADLTVIHASNWLAGVEGDETMLPPTMRSRLMDTAKGQVASLMREAECDAEVRIGFGRPVEYVARAVSELNIDMLVAGRRTGKDGGSNSDAYQLIRSASCPVLSV
jgi:nucleotide-binding universal stress UspA family protein